MNRKITRCPGLLVALGLMLGIGSIAQANQVPDPSFENGTKNWKLQDNTMAIVSSPTRTGSKALMMRNTGNGVNSRSHNASQERVSGIVPGKEYIYSVYVSGKNVRGIGGGGRPLGIVRWRDGAGNIVRSWDNKAKESYTWAPYGSYGFRQMKVALQAPSNAKFADFFFRTWYENTGGETYWDDVSLTPREFPGLGRLLATYQAENANVLSGGAINKKHKDYTGTGYYDIRSSGAVIEWKNVSGGGERMLNFRYSWEGNEQNLELFVNGVSQGIRKPMATGRRGTWASDLWQVNLPNANNTIRLKIKKKGGEKSQPMFDKLDVHAVGSGGSTGGLTGGGTGGSTGGGTGGGTTSNKAPTLAFISSKTVIEGDLLTIPVQASDVDSAAVRLSQSNTLPGKPSILSDFGNGIGEVSWTPSIGTAAGSPYSVTVTATDSEGATAKRVFNITVKSQGVSSGGSLSVDPAKSSSVVNLSSEGSADWAHWGLNSASDVDRKVGNPQISDVSPIGGASMPRGSNGSTVYSWNDGMPTASKTKANSGIRVYYQGKGFQFTVPAATTSKTLRVYLGAKTVSGRFEARLSDGSASPRSVMIDAIGGITSRVVTINFKAATDGQLLTVRYVIDKKPGSAGWISLESATLQGAGGSSGGGSGTGGGSTGGDTGTGGELSGVTGNPTSVVSLSNLGSSDWAHWGLSSASDFNGKARVSLISDVNAVGGAKMPRGTNSMAVYSWTGGAPTGNASKTNAGLRVYNIDKGFEFTVPATTSAQTLKVYVGAKNVSGTFKATLSDGSAPVYMTQVEKLNGITSQVISLNFKAASAGKKLTVRYVLTAKPGSTGWISLESAVLQ